MVAAKSNPSPRPARNANGTYGPTAKGHYYVPVLYHNRTARPRRAKTRWEVAEPEQYMLFRPADDRWWYCGQCSGLFSLEVGAATVLGSGGERLAFFPQPTNPKENWHGYPVASAEKQPSTGLIDAWLSQNIITEHVRRKLEAGRL